ncbi:O-antigen ligase family protein [Alteraurantiacibacter aestuarii]|uniref:O-antigen ligase family protein n=1 Tax=Alteraurantiacibacter aestuarii TaxID=650004 RepID=UPI0031CFD19A
MAIQLIPLPPSIWTSLPGRDVIASLGEVTGMGDIWRPLTFSPMKTANSLASLVVPVAGLMVLALLDDSGWRRLPWVFMVAGLGSALFSVAQIILPGATGLYLYEITNADSAVGLFSNRNHNALFLSVALLFCVIRLEQVSRKQYTPADLVAAVIALTIFAALLVNASRTGLAGLGLVGLIFGVRAILQWRAASARGENGGVRLLFGMAVGAASLALIGLFAAMGRSPAIERLIAHDAAEDQRLRSLPYVLDMLREFQPFGVGFGAFEQAFRTVEPESLLTPRYLNNAHNDWLQWPIEGGLPAIALLVVALFLIVRQVIRIARNQSGQAEMVSNAWLGILTVGIFALGSLIDYPLRTPSLMLLGAAALAMIFKPIANGMKG